MPTTQAMIKASERPSGETEIDTFDCEISKISIISDKTMIGRDMINENFADSLLSTPENRPALIVAPEREMPGKIASPCAIPIKSASFVEICFATKGREFFFFSAKNNRIALIKNEMPKNLPSNEIFAIGRAISAIKQVGIVAMIRFSPSLEKGCRRMCQISFLKTITTDKSVATCRMIETKRVSSSLKRLPNKTKCPLDETGKNSVNPCNRPKNASAKISTIPPL